MYLKGSKTLPLLRQLVMMAAVNKSHHKLKVKHDFYLIALCGQNYDVISQVEGQGFFLQTF